MLLTCPACAARHSIESATTDEAARELVALAIGIGSAAPVVIPYLALFRPAKRALRWGRALALMRELSGAYHAGVVRRRGRDHATRPEAWALGLETVLQARDAGKLRTPLRDHAYLWEVVIGHSERLAGAEEIHRDEERRARARPRSDGEAAAIARQARTAAEREFEQRLQEASDGHM